MATERLDERHETTTVRLPKDFLEEVQEFQARPEVQAWLANIRKNAGFGEIFRKICENGWPITQHQILNNRN